MLALLIVNVLIPLIAMGVCRLTLERRWPVTAPRKAGDRVNVAGFLFWSFTQLAATPALVQFGVLLTNRFGGGFIALPSHGWGLAWGFLVYFLVQDLEEYLYHRIQHAVPWLWAVHSLHHSDRSYDFTTAVLHHWLSPLIKAFAISVPVGLLFKVPTIDLILYSVVGYHVYLIHSNLRLDFGRWSWVLNSPSYHRLHHSASPEHFDCNYASILPIFDVLLGSYKPARPGEWPAVGIADGDEAKGLFDLVFWPVRGPMRALVGRAEASRPAL